MKIALWVLWLACGSAAATVFVVADGPMLVAPVVAIAIALLAPCFPDQVRQICADRRAMKGGAR